MTKQAGKSEPELNPLELRVHLLRRGDTLKEWADRNGYAHTTVFYAVRRVRRGPTSRAIVAKLAAELQRAA